MKSSTIYIVAAAILASVAGGSYFLMGGNKNSSISNLNTEYTRGNRIVMSNINPIPSELKENYFGGKRSKKKKYNSKKKKTTKR